MKESTGFKTYLCPPGAGVFTVNTAKERKESLYQRIYGTTQDINKSWHDVIDQFPNTRGTVLLGVCSDCGGGIQRGANWGPLFLRNTLVDNYPTNYLDIGDIRVIPHLLHDKYLNEKTIQGCKNALYENKESQYPVSPLSLTEHCCNEIYDNNDAVGVFAIGGDHSVSYPLVKSWLKAKNTRGTKVGLIHFDAHTDLLTERLGIDLCFGSWLTHVLPEMQAHNCYQFGIRSSGKNKEHWESTFGINQYWTDEIKEITPLQLVQRVIKELKENKVEELYVSFDIDALDSTIASATGTPEENGLFPHECMIILKELAREFKITGADMVEIAPLVGNDDLNAKKTLEAGAILSNFLIQEINNAYN